MSVLVAVERVDVDASGSPWREEHAARYVFAQRHSLGKEVLDVACGTGFGSEILLNGGAARLIAADLSEKALAASGRRLERFGPLAEVRREDVTAMTLPDDSQDLVVSFETIEHIEADTEYVAELERVLRPGGVAVVSTPNALVTLPRGGTPTNPFHVREYTPQALRRLMETRFEVVEHLGQHLPEDYGVAPFLPSFDRARLSSSERWSFFLWRVLLRAGPLKDLIHKARTGFSFYPQEQDYTFRADDLERAHVQVIVVRKR